MGKVTQPFVLASTGSLGVDVSGVRVGSAPAGPVTWREIGGVEQAA